MPDFRKLRVWRSAHALMINTHRAAQKLRSPEHLSLRSQMVRAAMSIPANIVEGRAQASERQFCRFLRYALASGRELEYHFLAARDIGALNTRSVEALSAQLDDVIRMLTGLIRKLESPTPVPPTRRVPA